MTLHPDFKVTPFDAKYLRNGTGYTNRDLCMPYTRVSFRVTVSDLVEVFNDTKYCVICLQ